jgi:L-ascorbate metabolism protein UlaG (beta-lactamase superfamily)
MRFETIGNATVICYEDRPVLATDPWIMGSAYFGSWKLSHEIPPAQRDAIKNVKYLWFSHGHPDHINAESLLALSDKTILLPDHVGARIKNDLTQQGLTTQVLPDREWVQLSPRIRVMCVSDYNQDALLFVDINGRLLVNFNDGNALGSERFVKKIIKGFKRSFLMRLFSYGDADMINYFEEDGERIPPAAAQKRPVGPVMQGYAEMYGVTDAIPFSCFHAYQRSDSAWVNQYTTPCDAFTEGFASNTVRLLPPFISYDCVTDQYAELNPAKSAPGLLDPSAFGDDWSEQLSADESAEIASYFHRIEALRDRIDAIIFRVGGKDTTIDIPRVKRAAERQIVFEVPRASLMSAVRFEVFDDLLIGNFMKTTLIGKWPGSRLHPFFTPVVAKYADNGRAFSAGELESYFHAYRSREPFEFIVHRFQQRSVQTFRNFVSPQSRAFDYGKRAFFFIKKMV